MSDSLWPHGLQHTKPPCLSLSPIVCLSSCPFHQGCHPAFSSSPPALNLSQHQGLFRWFGSSHQVAKVLELQHQSFQWVFRVDFLSLGLTGLILLLSKGLSRVFSSTTTQKHQFLSIQLTPVHDYRKDVVHWRREWQTTPLFLPWELYECDKKAQMLVIHSQIAFFWILHRGVHQYLPLRALKNW